ncbi:MAG: SRPBCC family protein [Chryseolinea sp.]
MNILLISLGIFFGCVALIFIIALFSRKGYSIEREIVIDKSGNEVFQYLRHIKNQDKFSVWVMKDRDMKKEFRGNDGTVGFVYAWEGNKQAGKGEQEIKSIEEGKYLGLEVRFEKPFVAVASTPFTVEAISPQQSRVIWGMTSSMNYPMNIMLLLMNMEKLLGKDMETSLKTLKSILEK